MPYRSTTSTSSTEVPYGIANLGIKVHAVQKDAMQVYIQVDGATEPLNEGDGPSLSMDALPSRALYDGVRNNADKYSEDRHYKLGLSLAIYARTVS